jgi:putative acetyltransferase
MIEIRFAVEADIPAIRERFREYAQWLQIDLCFQGFEKELAALPGDYAPPRGRLLVATDGDHIIGCVAVRPFGAADSGDCEMKRLYVVPAFRGQGIARRLADRLIGEAREAGYRRMLLDTLQQMEAARALYAQLGFAEIPAYYNNPIPGAVYLAKTL